MEVLPGVDLWKLLAVSAGDPITVAGEWNRAGFKPMTCWDGDRPVICHEGLGRLGQLCVARDRSATSTLRRAAAAAPEQLGEGGLLDAAALATLYKRAGRKPLRRARADPRGAR